MAQEFDPDRPDYYKWREDPFEFTTNPQILNGHPSTCILHDEIQVNLDGKRKFFFVEEIYYRGGRGLTPDRQQARENTVTAFRMFHFEDIPVVIIAQILNRDVPVVHRYIAEMEIRLFDCEQICLALKDEFVSNKDWKSLQVLHYLRIGKQIEEIMLISQQPFTYQCRDGHEAQNIRASITYSKVMDGDPPSVQWKNSLTLGDVVASIEKIRRNARIISNKIKRNRQEQANDLDAHVSKDLSAEMDT